MSTTYPQLQDLVASMKGVPSTNGWDVVCSYTIDNLNTFLEAQYQNNVLAKELKLSTTRADPLTGASYTIDYDVQLGTPTLSFVGGRSGVANLAMPIEDGSSYTVTPQGGQPLPSHTIPGGTYTITAVVPLAAVNGDTGTVSDLGTIITFSDTAVHTNSVIIHFRNEKGATFTITPLPSTDTDALVTYFLPVLQQYFQTQVSELDYALANVSNQPAPPGETVLTPASFAFATAGEADTGVLSLYIQTRESGNPSGNPSPSFQPGDSAVLPIPAGFTASLILSNALVLNTFLKPQLTACGFDVSVQPASEGISLLLSSSQSVVAEEESGFFVFSGYRYGGLDIPLNAPALNLVLAQAQMPHGQLSLHWQGQTSSEWSEYVAEGEVSSHQYGTVDLTVTLNKGPIPLTLSDEDLTIASVSLSNSDFAVSARAESCRWYEVLAGCSESVPAFYTQDMPLQVPPISITLNGLNYFKTTNLLAPGSHVITVDGQTGLQTPHDFLIVGQVTQQGSTQ